MSELHSASVTLAEILTYIKQTGQTGCLNVRVHGPAADKIGPAVLVFSNGHLVDAAAGDQVGDDIVYQLLGQRDATYSFDRRNADTLPTKRRIDRLQEMLVLAAIGILSEEDTGAPTARETAAFEAATGTADGPAVAAGPVPASTAAPHVAKTTPLPALTTPAVAEPTPLPVSVPPRRRPRPFKRRNMIPLPHGEAVYLVDNAQPGSFNELLTSLERDHLSGYVTWFSEGAEGLLIIYEGQVIDAFWAEVQSPATFAERHAVRRFAAAVDPDGHQHIEVYSLPAEFIWSYSSLAYGADHLSEQGLERVDLDALLARLTAAEFTGCVKAVANSSASYLFMAEGRQLGEYRAQPEALESDPGRTAKLIAARGSLVDIYTAPSPAELLALNAVVWPIERIITELTRNAREVLGPKSSQVLNLIVNAGTDPEALIDACNRAKKATRVFIGPEKHAELSRRIDRLLAHLQ